MQSQLTGGCSFPHEIGLFLGYPFDDVMGFIENRGENFLCSGCWKVYAKERDALACFCSYKDCTALYENLFAEGVSLECLASVDEDFPPPKPSPRKLTPSAAPSAFSDVRGPRAARRPRRSTPSTSPST